MYNKNKNSRLDPKRINNYNKFLSTLDKNYNFNTTIKEKKEKDLETNTKLEIEKLLNNIIQNYKLNNIHFSSLSENYIKPNTLDIDPNYYREIKNDKRKLKEKDKFESNIYFDKNIEINKPIIYKEYINIEVEIKNIIDLLNIIYKYKNDPEIKYNINIKILHEIKEPLEELNNMIGMEKLKNNIVDQILYFIQGMNKTKNGGDYMHTVLYGPPGTGKTEVAKIMGNLYSKLGILSKGTFMKVTRSDLIAGYLGQTTLKTRDVIKEAIGGVLFIDEAYSLGNSEKRDSFAKECIDTLCESLSDNKDNLMVIVAGYEKELKECFFNYNQGLDSRFTWRFKTEEYTFENLNDIFIKKIKDIQWMIDIPKQDSCNWFKKNIEYFKFYGRDIETLITKIKIAHSRRVFCKLEDEKRKIILKDLDKGLEIYLNNNEAKNIKEKFEKEKYLYQTLYS